MLENYSTTLISETKGAVLSPFDAVFDTSCHVTVSRFFLATKGRHLEMVARMRDSPFWD